MESIALAAYVLTAYGSGMENHPIRSRLLRAALVLIVLTAAFLAWLTHGSVRSLPRSRFEAPPASFKQWEDVFARAPRVELDSLDTGKVLVAREKNLQPREAALCPPEPEPLHVFAHLIRHPSYGDVLIDSGLDASFARASYGNIRTPASIVLSLTYDAPYSQAPGQDIRAQLAAIPGSRPVAVKKVFFTHLHMDHTAGVPSLDRSVELVIGRGEADDFAQHFGFGHIPSDARLTELDFRSSVQMAYVGPAIDVFGDGSLWAISTPGHSLGHVSFLVNATSGPVLLTGDAAHFRWAFEHGAPPRAPDAQLAAAARESLERLRAFAAHFPQVTVFTGHEAPAPREASR